MGKDECIDKGGTFKVPDVYIVKGPFNSDGEKVWHPFKLVINCSCYIIHS